MTAQDYSGHVGNFEPTDPTPLRSRVVSNEEFNYLAVHHRKPIEFGDTTAVLVVGSVMYVTQLEGEVAC